VSDCTSYTVYSKIICLIILFILNILIDNAEKTSLEAKVDEIVMKQNEAIPQNIRGKKNNYIQSNLY
jgi:low affinity Fe/Cu permease